MFNEDAILRGETLIKLKGIAVGNPATRWEYDTTPSYLPMAFMHNLMDKETWTTITENECQWYFRDVFPAEGKDLKACADAYRTFNKNTARINWYDLYRDVYDDGPITSPIGETTINGETKYYKRGITMGRYTPWLADQYGEEGPRLGDYMSDYMNKPEVREAFHIPDHIQPYTGCTNDPEWDYHL